MSDSRITLVDRRLVSVAIIICLILAASLVYMYVDFKRDLTGLTDSNANLSAQVDQLQGLINALHVNQTQNLTAVQIYNRTKQSVVLIVSDQGGGSASEGTGFVFDSQGHIITNNHVVSGSIGITVTFFDGTVAQAQLTGYDVYSDLAVIQVSSVPEQAHPVTPGNSTQLLVGEPVYAIGNPFGLSSSMTSGIVSQLGRVLKLSDLGAPSPWGNYSIADVIQFDAAINPGNSGGPLLDSFGQVIGVTFAIETGGSGERGFIGIGYAVPVDLLNRVVPSLIAPDHHYYHPYVGIEYDSRYTGGVLIVSVVQGGPAASVGLQADDILKKVDGHAIERGENFIIYLERYKSPGDTITLEVVRGGTTLPPITLTLGQRPV
jgi:S1-C subfamily serine protease